MKKESKPIFHLTFCGFICLLMLSCEYDRPAKLFEPTSGAPTPVITNVDPPSAQNGITRLTISGENFVPEAEANFVYFGTFEGKVISARQDQLIVERPIAIQGDYALKLITRNAFNPAQYGLYSLEAGIVQLGEKDKYNCIAVDHDHNLYADKDNIIYKITFNGAISEYGTLTFGSTCMKFGSDGYLYLQRRENRDLYRIAPGGGAAERYARAAKKVSFFDFDQDGYIYSGGLTDGFYITNPDGSGSVEVLGYQDLFAISTVRVFDGYVYVSADTITEEEDDTYTAIFCHEIKGNGQVGERTLKLHWKTTGTYAQATLFNFIFSSDGKMIVATDSENPFLVINEDGSMQPLYAGVLKGPATYMAWAQSNYMYYLLTAAETVDSGIFRVIMGQNGTP